MSPSTQKAMQIKNERIANFRKNKILYEKGYVTTVQ